MDSYFGSFLYLNDLFLKENNLYFYDKSLFNVILHVLIFFIYSLLHVHFDRKSSQWAKLGLMHEKEAKSEQKRIKRVQTSKQKNHVLKIACERNQTRCARYWRQRPSVMHNMHAVYIACAHNDDFGYKRKVRLGFSKCFLGCFNLPFGWFYVGNFSSCFFPLDFFRFYFF